MSFSIRNVNVRIRRPTLLMALLVFLGAGATANDANNLADEIGPSPKLHAPQASESAVNYSNVVGWPKGQTPTAPKGFVVQRFAHGLISPRLAYVLPNGDVLIAESSTVPDRDMTKEAAHGLRQAGNIQKNMNRITLLRDADGDGQVDLRNIFLGDLNQPFGMVLVGDDLYVANTDALVRFPYEPGQTRIDTKGEKILDLPAGDYNNHWTRNVIASRDGEKLYVSVGSATNVDEEHIDIKDARRAAILEINPDGSGLRLVADGLRNPNGMDWAPGTNALWTVVNERDELGNELVPDYLTRVRKGAFYGWPYSYFGQHPDPRHKGERPDLVRKAIAPDYALGAHTASLGLQFYTGKTFPIRYWGDAFVTQHGSWNRSEFVGYKVLRVPFEDDAPAGPAQDFLTGFLADEDDGEVYGRPVGLAVMNDGSMLVTDDAAGMVWRIAPENVGSIPAASIDGFEQPESALQVADGQIFVSEIGQSDTPGDGRIARVTPQGAVERFVTGLDDPKGLAWWGDWLYVADVDGVWRIDRFGHPILMAGLKDFPSKPIFLNDLAAASDGTLYVSDTGDLKQGGGTVFKVDQSGVVTHVFPDGKHAELQNPNGLLIENATTLLVADFVTEELHRVDLTSGKTTRVAGGLGAADGIAKAAKAQHYVSDWKSGEVFRVNRDGRVKPLGTAERFGVAADIRVTQDGNYLMVPDMKAGKLAFIALHTAQMHTKGSRTTSQRPSAPCAVSCANLTFARPLKALLARRLDQPTR
jgi:glucose/arabinose dehydrogenase